MSAAEMIEHFHHVQKNLSILRANLSRRGSLLRGLDGIFHATLEVHPKGVHLSSHIETQRPKSSFSLNVMDDASPDQIVPTMAINLPAYTYDLRPFQKIGILSKQ